MEPNYSSFCVHNKFWMCMHTSMRTSKMSVKYVLKQIYFRHENNTFSNFIHSKRLFFPCNVYSRFCCLMFNKLRKKNPTTTALCLLHYYLFQFFGYKMIECPLPLRSISVEIFHCNKVSPITNSH